MTSHKVVLQRVQYPASTKQSPSSEPGSRLRKQQALHCTFRFPDKSGALERPLMSSPRAATSELRKTGLFLSGAV